MALDREQNKTAQTAPDLICLLAKNLRKGLETSAKLGCNPLSQDGTVKLLAGFSGGPDSTALLLALHAVAETGTYSIFACHVNYGLRGVDSLADQDFCRSTCERLKIPLDVVSIDKLPSQPSEALLRDLRYDAFSKIARKNGCQTIVLGHTLNDQAETLFLRLLRGTSLSGITGMTMTRRHDCDLCIVRPLLNATREQCLAFLQEQEVEARQDTSNFDPHFTRNYVRNRILPVIQERFDDYVKRIETFRQIVSDENALLERLAQDEHIKLSSTVDWQLSTFVMLAPAIQRRVIALELTRKGIESSFERIESIRHLATTTHASNSNQCATQSEPFPSRESTTSCSDRSSQRKRLSLDARWDASIDQHQGTLRWVDKTLAANVAAAIGKWIVKVPGATLIPFINMALVVETLNDVDPSTIHLPPPDSLTILVNTSELKSPLVLRARQPGDYIRPLGMPESVRLKKYLHTHKSNRNDLWASTMHGILLATGQEILWIPGVGISSKLKVRLHPLDPIKATHRFSWVQIRTDELDLA